MPVQDGLITLRTGICKFFTKTFPETDEHSTLKFPEFLLFESFIKIGYFTFIIPFRFLKASDGQFHIKTNAVQQVISTVLVFSSALYSLLSIRLLFQMDLKRNPSEAFAVIFGMMKKSFIAVWLYTFWFHRENFSNFLRECQATSSPSLHFARYISSAMLSSSVVPAADNDGGRKNSVDWKVALAARLIVLLAAAKLATETYHTFLTWDGIPSSKKPYKGNTTGNDFYDYVLRANLEAGWKSFQVNYTVPPTSGKLFRHDFIIDSIATFVFMLLGIIQDYVCNMIDAFCFVGAALVYSVCWRFTQDIPQMKGQDGQQPTNFLKVLERMSMEFLELTNVVERTNDIFGPLFLLYIMGAFPSLGGFMMFKQLSSVTGVPLGSIAIVSSVGMHILVAMVASEGSSKMGDYKSWLFDASLLRKKPPSAAWKTDASASQHLPTLSNAVLSKLNHLHREVSSDTIGLKGCGFFTMTHGLIGTLLGIFVTFAIVIVQFEMDMANK